MADAVALFTPALADVASERFCVAYLDGALALLGCDCSPPGAADRVELSLRTVMRKALALDARALLVAHNHPAGTPEPSAADRRATRRLADAARLLDMRLIDHLLFAGERVVSFRALGLL